MHFSSFIVFNMPILFQPWLCGIQNVIRQTKYSAIPHDLLLSSVCVEKKRKTKAAYKDDRSRFFSQFCD